MISYDRKFFAINVIFKTFYRPNHSKKLKFVYTITFSFLFKNLDAKEIGFQPLTVNCSNAVPRPERRASHFTRVSSCGL